MERKAGRAELRAEYRRRVVFPWWMGLAARCVGLLPLRLSSGLMALPPGKAPLQAQGG